MKLRKGKADYALPEMGHLLNVIVVEKDGLRMLFRQPPELLLGRSIGAKTGPPETYAVFYKNGAQRLLIYPPPPRAMEIRIRYYPPAVEC